MSEMLGKRLLLGVTGGIAAYKSAELIRLLRKSGVEVQVVMTQAATQFISPLSLQAFMSTSLNMEGILTEAAGILKEDVWRKEVSCGIEPFHLQLLWRASTYVESLQQVVFN